MKWCFIISAEPLPPENLQIKHGATSAYLKWTDPITDDKIKHRFRVVCSDEANTIESFTDVEEENILSLQTGTKYTFSVYTLVESNDEVHESLPVKLTRCTSNLLFLSTSNNNSQYYLAENTIHSEFGPCKTKRQM